MYYTNVLVESENFVKYDPYHQPTSKDRIFIAIQTNYLPKSAKYDPNRVIYRTKS